MALSRTAAVGLSLTLATLLTAVGVLWHPSSDGRSLLAQDGGDDGCPNPGGKQGGDKCLDHTECCSGVCEDGYCTATDCGNGIVQPSRGEQCELDQGDCCDVYCHFKAVGTVCTLGGDTGACTGSSAACQIGGGTRRRDADRDGIVDTVDNCIGIANPDQRDADRDGVGDACDPDAASSSSSVSSLQSSAESSSSCGYDLARHTWHPCSSSRSSSSRALRMRNCCTFEGNRLGIMTARACFTQLEDLAAGGYWTSRPCFSVYLIPSP